MILSSMRTGVFSGLFLGILLLGGLGLVLSDGAGTFRDGVGKTDVVEIDGNPIKSVEFDRIVRRQLQQQQISTSDAYKAGYVDRILQNEVMSRLMRKAAYNLGIIASDQVVANELHKALQPMAGPNGDTKQALAQILQVQGMSEKALVESMRNDISTGLLRETIGGGVYVPDAMSKAFYQWNLEERSIKYVSLPATAVKLDKATDEEINKFYDSIKTEYTIPESRDVTVGIIDPNLLIKKEAITDAKVKDFYESNKKDFEKPETRTLEQAVLKTEKEANDVLALAKDSKNLKTAVTKATGKSEGYNGIDSFDKKVLPEQLSEPVFTAKTENFIGPIKTPLGYHVIFVKSVEPAGVKPFDTVKAQIKKELSEGGNNDAVFEITNQIEDRLADGEKLENLADEFKMKIIPLGKIDATTTKVTPLSAYSTDQTKIIQTALTTKANESSPLSEVSGGKMFTVHVNNVIEGKAKDLKDVKAEVTDKWSALEKRRKMLVKALEITSALDEEKTTLEKVAKEYGASIKTAKIVRGNKPPEGFNSQNISQIMTADTKKAIAIPDITTIQIVKIEKVSLPVKNPTSSELENIEKNLSLDLQEERFVSFVNHVERNSKVNVNRKLLDQLYGQEATEQ